MFTPLDQRILLSQLPGLGAGAYWKLVDAFADFDALLAAPAEQLRPWLGDEALAALRSLAQLGPRSDAAQLLNRTLDWAAANGVQLVDFASEHYPALLKEIRRPPPLLYLRGRVEALALAQIAVVGSRHPSPGGKSNAVLFAAELARRGLAVTSGLALGIDAAAHRGALQGQGVTLAVIGSGIDKLYPARNRRLADEILAGGGAIVSEFPVGTPALPVNFPQRNRLISGLSYGTLVVEAAIKSGSLITARYAIEQNRELFAIPGSIHNPLARGGHALIKQGATLVESAQDIVDQLRGFAALEWERAAQTELFSPPAQALSAAERALLDRLGYDPVGIDELSERCGLPIQELTAGLLGLELKEQVVHSAAGYCRCAASLTEQAAEFEPR